jgi:hypothetical protein
MELDNDMILTAKIVDLKTTAATIRAELALRIWNFPDNPDITRVKGASNCFHIRASTLIKHDNWNTIFYDYKHQYKKLIEKIYDTEPTNLIEMFENAIQNRYIIVEGEKIQLHPAVIKKMEELL